MPYKDPRKQKKYLQRHYKINKATYQRSRNQNVRNLKELVRKLKASKPCHDCGRKWHPCQMQFDHLVGQHKIGSISGLIKSKGRRYVLEELPKCQLVCANCHAMRTWRRIVGLPTK